MDGNIRLILIKKKKKRTFDAKINVLYIWDIYALKLKFIFTSQLLFLFVSSNENNVKLYLLLLLLEQ